MKESGNGMEMPFQTGFWAAIAWSIPVVPDRRSPRCPARIVSRHRIRTAARCLLASSRCQNDRCTNCITVLMLNVQSLQKSCVASFREGEFWELKRRSDGLCLRTVRVPDLPAFPTKTQGKRQLRKCVEMSVIRDVTFSGKSEETMGPSTDHTGRF